MSQPSSRRSNRAFFLSSAATFATIGSVSAPAKAAQFEFKCGTPFPLSHPSSVRLTQMWTVIERETGGRLRTQFFPNSMLGGDSAMFAQARLGALQFILAGGALSFVVPASLIQTLGFAYKDADEALRVMDGPVGNYIRDETATKGLYLLRTAWDSGMFSIGGSRPIRTPEDLRAFKVALLSGPDLFKELGAVPVELSLAERYTGLQTHIIDGTATPLVTIESARMFEVMKYISMTNHAWSGIWLACNPEAWKSLPTDIQEIVQRNATKYAILERRDTKLLNISLADKLRRRGIAFNSIDPMPFRALLKNYYTRWAATFGPTEWGYLESSLGHKLT